MHDGTVEDAGAGFQPASQSVRAEGLEGVDASIDVDALSADVGGPAASADVGGPAAPVDGAPLVDADHPDHPDRVDSADSLAGEWSVPGVPMPSCQADPAPGPTGPGGLVAGHPVVARWLADLVDLADGAADLGLAAQTDLMLALVGFTDLLAANTATVANVWREQGAWGLDGSLTPGAALAAATGHSRTACNAVFRRARRVHDGSMPATAVAWRAGELPTDTVDLLLGANTRQRQDLFTDHEPGLVAELSKLRHADAEKAVTYWRNHADAALGLDGKPERKRHLRLSPTFDDAYAISGILDPVGGALLATAVKARADQFKRDDRKALDDAMNARATKTSSDGSRTIEGDAASSTGVDAGTNTASAAGGDEGGPATLPKLRTETERNADALVALIQQAQAAPADAKKAKIALHIALGDSALSHLCETRSGIVLRPVDLVDYLNDATIQFTLFDADTHQPTAGSRTMDFTRFYRGATRYAMDLRDRHCQHESGCDQPAQSCDGDHTRDWATTRRTVLRDGRLLCIPHNRIPQLRKPPNRPNRQ